jgi:mycothiol synthase
MPPFEISVAAGGARVRRSGTEWAIEVDPGLGDAAITPLLAAAVAYVASQGGGRARHWGPAEGSPAASMGFRADRHLHQMRLTLPVGIPYDLATRPFVVGQDEQQWLAVNNRAFSWHPEQAGWTLEDLLIRQAEGWYDSAGFLLHESDGTIDGFCWTKVHHHHEPPLGEIYVIAIDPGAQGVGLGRALVLAGLDHLHEAGMEWGMLHVEDTNTAALALYRRLGFEIDHTEVNYVIDVSAP